MGQRSYVSPAYLSRFRSSESAQEYLAAYEAALALWSVPHEELDVETKYGTTHINAAGSPEAPPLVLVHGAQTSSTVWHPNAGALSRHFRVYALDVIDQSGKSVPARKLMNRQDCADWLCGVLDALNIERAAFVGHSHGGWQVLNLAVMAPRRVDRMVLLSPAGITRLRWETFLRLLPVFIIPAKSVFYWGFQWSTVRRLNARRPDPLFELMISGGNAYKPNELSLGVVHVFDDEELRQAGQPTLLLVGDREKAFDPHRMVERARRLLPHVTAEIIPNAAHLLPVDQAETVNSRMLEFFT